MPTAKEVALKLAKTRGSFTANDVAKASGLSRAAGGLAVKELFVAGVLIRRKDVGNDFHYSLKGEGQQVLAFEEPPKPRGYKRRVQTTSKIAEAMEILFPNMPVSEDLVAWMVWTKELLDG